MKEFKTFAQLERFLRKQGHELMKGSNERKNMKYLFSELGSKKKNMAVMAVTARCMCGYTGDEGGIMMVDKESDNYKRWKGGKIPRMMCARCNQLLMTLMSMVDLDKDELHEIATKIWEITLRKPNGGIKTGGD